MSLYQRSAQEIAAYKSLPQVPVDSEEDTHATSFRRSLDLDDEETLAEELVTQEVQSSSDARIWWIHFVLGCAVLLPWNGACLYARR